MYSGVMDLHLDKVREQHSEEFLPSYAKGEIMQEDSYNLLFL
jgi:hypothetical protein